LRLGTLRTLFQMWNKSATLAFRPALIEGTVGTEMFNKSVTCDIGKMHYYPVEAVQCAVLWHYHAYAAIHAYARQISPSYVTINYEDLERDPEGVIRRLFDVIDADAKHDISKLLPRKIRTTQFTVKHTGEDLRETIINFGEVREALGFQGCLVDMLTTTESRTFPHNEKCVPPRTWRDKCAKVLATPRPTQGCTLRYFNEQHVLVPVFQKPPKTIE